MGVVVHENQKSILPLGENRFRSGVLLKPVRLELRENSTGNSLVIYYERSSYAAAFAFEHLLKEHPLLQGHQNSITEMNACDEQAEEELIRCPETGDNLIGSVNRYLEKCSNVCRITLSANIITSDDVLLLCRHTGDNALYPCVYGEAELRADCRDFREDAGRQTYEWLREILPYQEWDCCGVIICGSHPYPEQFCSPLEFSILFEQQSERDYIEIENRSGTSAGSSEIDEPLPPLPPLPSPLPSPLPLPFCESISLSTAAIMASYFFAPARSLLSRHLSRSF